MSDQAAGVYAHGEKVTAWPAHGGKIPVHGGLSPIHGSPNASTIFAIANRANTTVTGTGPQTIQKTGGANSTYDSSAVSSVGIAGNFVLQLSDGGYGANGSAVGGMNADPLTNDSFSGIDYFWLSVGTGWQLQGGGGILPGAYAWIWRVGTALGMGRGATLATAQAAPDFTTTDSNTLFFDSSFFNSNDRIVALLTA